MIRPALSAALLLAATPATALSLLDEPPGLAPFPDPVFAPMEGPGFCAPAPSIEEAQPPAAVASAEDDDPGVKEEVDAESQELQDLQAAEEEAGVGEVSPAAGPDGADAGARIALLPEIDHGLAELQAEYDIPIEVNEAVVQFVRFFQNPRVRPHFVKWLSRYYRYEARYRAILREHGLPEDTVFLAMIESGFANFAYSRARASGPWQFISSTGKMFGLKQDFWVDERRNPDKAAHAAARYLKQLREQTGDWRLAWAGYNAGAGRILRAQRKGVTDFWEMTKGRHLRRETKGYVPKLMAAAIVTKHREAFGFGDDEVERLSWIEVDEVHLNGSVLLAVVARAAGVSEREIMELNPELRRAVTPPSPFVLRLPKGSSATFAENWPALEAKARARFAGHVVRRGDTLGAIALRWGVPVEGIMQMNGIKSARRLRVGQELLIPIPRGPGGLVASASAETPAPARRAAPRNRQEPREAPPAPLPAIVGARHVVKLGDTLWSISQRLGIDLETLCRWNGIRNPRRYTLRVGTELVVRPQGG